MRRLGYLVMLWLVGMAPSAVLAAPPTVYDPPRKYRFISLAEARAIALENGKIGQASLLFPGISGSSITVPQQGEPEIPGRVVCKPRSKCLILTGIPCDSEHEGNIHQMLFNTECAYWNLCGSYWKLYSREEGLRRAQKSWRITEALHKAGRVSSASVAQAEGQYNLFRSQRLAALDTVLDNERQLRAMLGMKIKDGTRLVPSDAPTLVEKKPNWKAGLRTTMKKRPELEMARQDVKVAQLNVQLAKNNLMPDLHSSSAHDDNAIGNRPDVSTRVNNASHNQTPNTFNDWILGGVRLTMPIGFRSAHAQQRQSQLQLARAYLVLQDQELKAERYLGLWYRRMSSAYYQIKAARAQSEAFATQLKIREELYRAGANEPGTSMPMTLNLLLEAQRFWAESLATESQAIVTYNNALAGWAYAKGDIMKHAHVQLVEKTPDDSAEVSAVEREHKRTRQHVRHEPAVAAESPLAVLDACGSDTKAAAPSLPALWKRFPLLKEVGEVQTGLIEGRGVH